MLKLGATAPPPPPPPVATLGVDLPLASVLLIFAICIALKAPAKPACINGYAGNSVVILLLLAVVNAF